MPREPLPLIRTGGFLEAEKMFVLAFEGNVTEPYYFRNLRSSEIFNDSGFIEIIPLPRPKKAGNGDPLSVKKLLKEAKKNYRFVKTDEFWLIIDRDHWEEIHHHNFELLHEECQKEKNFFMALSNPCFEIWILFHYAELNNLSDEEMKLIFENKPVSKSKNYIDKALEVLTGRGYNKIPPMKDLLPLTKNAIINAKSIDDPLIKYPKSLGTHVYKLVEKLIK